MRKRDLVPVVLLVGLLTTIGGMTIQTRQLRSEAEARRERARAAKAAANEAGEAEARGYPVTSVADVMTASAMRVGERASPALRGVALPAPDRDLPSIRRQLAARSGGTYIEAMLAADDSMLVRWPDRTLEALRVWVQPHADVPNWSGEYPRMVRDVFPEWSEAGFPIRFLHVIDSAAADLHIVFRPSFAGRRIGLTNRTRDQHGWIVGAEIIIATQDDGGRPFSPSLVAGIARHEVGHALGLGHADDRRAVMYPESHTTTIAPVDRATLHLLYTLPPGLLK